MRFESSLVEVRLLRRYKRFLADMEFPDGRRLTVHCPNTGAMLGCDRPGSRAWLSLAANPARKYRWTWELVEAENGVLVGIHTGRSNGLVREAIGAGLIPGLKGYTEIRAEVAAAQGFRVDFLLSAHASRPDCYLEVKNVTAAVSGGIAVFPDAISERASRHLRELMVKAQHGQRAMLCFCVQRDDVQEVRPADVIDRVYGQTLREAMQRGVEVCACVARITPEELMLYRLVPVNIE
ncbi:MAG TPA: DNA/RNA nuclease SfsA [Gammaproteobacteria bacterium]|nr:DNA/RNA nuclease SfsA [Gammaproteobacteria bacterium]